MIYNLVRKGGIPVLASLTPNAASQWSCSLVVKYLEAARPQATISLQSSVPVQGFDDNQIFTLLYDADNLVPGETRLQSSPTPLSQDRLNEIARQGNAQLKTLCLSLKAPCPMWCPRSSGSIAPKHGFDALFHQFAELAGATQVYVLFDWNWLHKDHHARFQRLFTCPELLTGIPVDHISVGRYRQADWSVFGLADHVASEAPPPYTFPSKKRRRQATTTTPTPSPKRKLLSPAPLFTTSPTEKATTASTPSPKPRLGSPAATSFDFQEAILRAVEALLPQALHTVLPDMLPRLFVLPSTSPSPSPSPSLPSLQRSSRTKPKPKSRPPLGTLISDHAAAQVEAQLQRIHAETLDRAADIHNAAEVDFRDILDEQRIDVAMVKEDGIAELNRAFDNKLVEFRESAAEIVDDLEQRVELVYADVCERIDELVGNISDHPGREGNPFEETSKASRQRRRKDAEGRSRRAMSLPL
ncbi:hypothetical protein DDE82_008397 [Stemphylium lycopersici]|uniref:Uncharacterized protein n=1 Tax=Stemphylium lycopersici TaxID=183478 RepID=A0A364N0B8_STELY|nr:hypothetical protein DDE82_008397 [Stemphylium lycopersici]RAR08461.1 hypothetical protein DDE83_005944 [Stemphylium lycopersici]